MRMLERHRLITMVALVSVLLSSLLVIGACGSSTVGPTVTSAAGATGSSTTPAGGGGTGDLATYTDSDFGYSFEYPKSWKLQKGDSSEFSAGGSAVSSVGVFDPKGAVAQDTYIDLAQVSVYKLNQAIDDSMMPEVKTEVESVLASLESQAADMKVVEALAQTTVDGINGFKVTYSFSKNEAPAVTTLYFLFSGSVEYQVTVQAAEENWSAKKPIFAALIASFKPGAAK